MLLRHEYRYHATLMRHRFDQNKDVKDMRIAKKLLIDGEEELFMNSHGQQILCKYFLKNEFLENFLFQRYEIEY